MGLPLLGVRECVSPTSRLFKNDHTSQGLKPKRGNMAIVQPSRGEHPRKGSESTSPPDEQINESGLDDATRSLLFNLCWYKITGHLGKEGLIMNDAAG
jgi:hypothetical protein